MSPRGGGARTPVPAPEIEAARERLRSIVTPTPLVRLEADAGVEVYLKLESLQPIGSFKIRGAGNALARRRAEILDRGVATASAGNMGQGVAWCARRLGARCHVAVPQRAPATKLEALHRLGARVIELPFEAWWEALVAHRIPGVDAVFVHPVSDPDVMAGNGTIGLEVLEALPEVDTIVVPFGGGGLSCGIASALRGRGHPARVLACEVETAAPLAASLARDEPCAIEHRPSFVDGIGGKSVLVEMWPLVRDLLAGSVVVSLTGIADAVRLLAVRNHVVAEGAGAASVAAVLGGGIPGRRVVCIVSGGNIDAPVLSRILAGETPP